MTTTNVVTKNQQEIAEALAKMLKTIESWAVRTGWADRDAEVEEALCDAKIALDNAIDLITYAEESSRPYLFEDPFEAAKAESERKWMMAQ